MIRSLWVLGERDHAIAFKTFACEDLVNHIKVPLTTIKFWRESISEEDLSKDVAGSNVDESDVRSEETEAVTSSSADRAAKEEVIIYYM